MSMNCPICDKELTYNQPLPADTLPIIGTCTTGCKKFESHYYGQGDGKKVLEGVEYYEDSHLWYIDKVKAQTQIDDINSHIAKLKDSYNKKTLWKRIRLFVMNFK